MCDGGILKKNKQTVSSSKQKSLMVLYIFINQKTNFNQVTTVYQVGQLNGKPKVNVYQLVVNKLWTTSGYQLGKQLIGKI